MRESEYFWWRNKDGVPEEHHVSEARRIILGESYGGGEIRADKSANEPLAGEAGLHTSHVSRREGFTIWRQESESKDSWEPVCEARGEDEAQADDTHTIFREEATDINVGTKKGDDGIA